MIMSSLTLMYTGNDRHDWIFLVVPTVVTKVEILELVPINNLDARPRAWFDASPMMVTVRSDMSIK